MSKYLSIQTSDTGTRQLVLAENIVRMYLDVSGGLPYTFFWIMYTTSLVDSGATPSLQVRLELSGTGVRLTDKSIYNVFADLIELANDNESSVYKVPLYLPGMTDTNNQRLSIYTIATL